VGAGCARSVASILLFLVPTLRVGVKLYPQGLPRRAWEPGDAPRGNATPTLRVWMQLYPQRLPRRAWEPDVTFSRSFLVPTLRVGMQLLHSVCECNCARKGYHAERGSQMYAERGSQV